MSGRYLTKHSTVTLGKRRFTIKTVQAKMVKSEAGDIDEKLAAMKLQDAAEIFVMDWKAKVSLAALEKDTKSGQGSSSKTGDDTREKVCL